MVSIPRNIAISFLLASDSNSSKGSLDHVNVAKSCYGKTLLYHNSEEFKRKSKNNW